MLVARRLAVEVGVAGVALVGPAVLRRPVERRRRRFLLETANLSQQSLKLGKNKNPVTDLDEVFAVGVGRGLGVACWGGRVGGGGGGAGGGGCGGRRRGGAGGGRRHRHLPRERRHDVGVGLLLLSISTPHPPKKKNKFPN